MFRIVMSRNEGYKKAIESIIDCCRCSSVSAEAIEIEVLNDTSFRDTDIVFFLTNDHRVGRFATNLSSRGIKVVNFTYLIGNQAKSYTHRQVQAVGITGPCLVSDINLQQFEINKDVRELGFPLYVKSERHESGVFGVKNVTELNSIIAELDSSAGWYLEASVDALDRRLEKLYWVAGFCFGRDKQRAPRADVTEAMDIIGKTLSFDVFSADFIIGKDVYWCIDINPAPGLFGSKMARKALVNFVQSLLVCNLT